MRGEPCVSSDAEDTIERGGAAGHDREEGKEGPPPCFSVAHPARGAAVPHRSADDDDSLSGPSACRRTARQRRREQTTTGRCNRPAVSSVSSSTQRKSQIYVCILCRKWSGENRLSYICELVMSHSFSLRAAGPRRWRPALPSLFSLRCSCTNML